MSVDTKTKYVISVDGKPVAVVDSFESAGALIGKFAKKDHDGHIVQRHYLITIVTEE